jgi:hypothetical protein
LASSEAVRRDTSSAERRACASAASKEVLAAVWKAAKTGQSTAAAMAAGTVPLSVGRKVEWREL